MTAAKPLLRDVPPADLVGLLTARGEPAFRGRQLAGWLYGGGAMDWDAMSNLPRGLRSALATEFTLRGLRTEERQVSADGTRKHLFQLADGSAIEGVTIPMEGYPTFCISSQVGCAMACSFCATARGGLVRNLTRGEIVEQVLHLAADAAAEPVPGCGGRGFNIVFMGMGEPLDNFAAVAGAIETFTSPDGLDMSPRRIQVSTSGHREGLEKLLESDPGVGLTISVNGCEPQLRRRLMPVAARTPLAEILDLGEKYARRIRRTVTIAYVLIDGVNDHEAEAGRLADLVPGRPFKVNLIPMNSIDARFAPPPRERILAFQRVLAGRGVRSFIRLSGGEDIDAACGQLRNRRRDGNRNPAGAGDRRSRRDSR